MPTTRLLIAALACLSPVALGAQNQPKDSGAAKTPASPPKSEQWVTRHSIVIGGKPVSYVATAGTLMDLVGGPQGGGMGPRAALVLGMILLGVGAILLRPVDERRREDRDLAGDAALTPVEVAAS